MNRIEGLKGGIMSQEKTLSENISTYAAGKYIVTAARWMDSYEIGIRHKSDGTFSLVQNRRFSHQSVQDVANAISHLLSMPTEHYSPEWCQDWFGES